MKNVISYLLLLTGSALAAVQTPITLVQSAQVQGTGVSSVRRAFPSTNKAGNLIIAFVRMSTATQTVRASDTAGNVYSDAVMQAQTTDGHQIHILYAKKIVGGANTVTATFSSTNNHPWLAIFEYSGLSTTTPLDQTAHAQGSSSSPSSGLTLTTTSANELVFAGMGMPNASTIAVTAGSGFAIVQQDASPNTSRAATENKITNTTGRYAGTFTLGASTRWTAVVATFKTATLRTIAVTPANSSLATGATQQFTATGTYSDGTTKNLTSTSTWSSSSTAVATISSTGLAKGVSAGTTTISATSSSVTGSTGLRPQSRLSHLSERGSSVVFLKPLWCPEARAPFEAPIPT